MTSAVGERNLDLVVRQHFETNDGPNCHEDYSKGSIDDWVPVPLLSESYWPPRLSPRSCARSRPGLARPFRGLRGSSGFRRSAWHVVSHRRCVRDSPRRGPDASWRFGLLKHPVTEFRRQESKRQHRHTHARQLLRFVFHAYQCDRESCPAGIPPVRQDRFPPYRSWSKPTGMATAPPPPPQRCCRSLIRPASRMAPTYNGTSTTQDLTLAPCAPGAAVVARAREPRRARPGERPLLRRPARQQPSPRARRWRQRYAARCCTRRPPPRTRAR